MKGIKVTFQVVGEGKDIEDALEAATFEAHELGRRLEMGEADESEGTIEEIELED